MIDNSSHDNISNEELETLIKMASNWVYIAQNWDENVESGLQMAIQDFKDYNDSEKELFQQIWIDFFRYDPINFVRGMVKLGYDAQFIQKEGDRAHIIVYNPNIIEVKDMKKRESLSENDNINESDYSKTKKSIESSKSISKEKKDEILKHLGGGSSYKDGKVYGLKKPKVKGKSFDGVSLGADKDGFFVYTHRARSKSKESPDKIPQKDIDFIESTG